MWEGRSDFPHIVFISELFTLELPRVITRARFEFPKLFTHEVEFRMIVVFYRIEQD